MRTSGLVELGSFSFWENLLWCLHQGSRLWIEDARREQVFNGPVNVLLREVLRVLAHHIRQMALSDFKLVLLLLHELLVLPRPLQVHLHCPRRLFLLQEYRPGSHRDLIGVCSRGVNVDPPGTFCYLKTPVYEDNSSISIDENVTHSGCYQIPRSW